MGSASAAEISATDRRRIADLVHDIEVVREGDPPDLGRFVPAVASLMRTDSAGTYALSPAEEDVSVEVDHLYTIGGSGDANAKICRLLRRADVTGVQFFNPLRPEPAQRNVALTLRGLERVTGLSAQSIPMTRLTKEVGLWRGDQIRVLLCDGPVLLAWFGAFRRESFGARERRILEMLRRPLQKRARLHRLLSRQTLHLSALEAAFEMMGAAAFLTTTCGSIVYANSAARSSLDAGAGDVLTEVKKSLRGESDVYRVTRVRTSGMRDHFLAVRRPRSREVESRLFVFATRWQLTPRQREVLGLLVRGLPNKTIAAALGCALRTIEVHVSALLEKTGSESRAALVSKFWTA